MNHMLDRGFYALKTSKDALCMLFGFKACTARQTRFYYINVLLKQVDVMRIACVDHFLWPYAGLDFTDMGFTQQQHA